MLSFGKMKRLPVAFLCLALALLSLCCCSRKGKVIPRDDMADIYYDMFVADQWLQDHREFRETADTTLFYEALFRRHGYSTADYFRSVQHYMRDPKRYGRMIQEVIDRLEADRVALDKLANKESDRQAERQRIRSLHFGVPYYRDVFSGRFSTDTLTVFVDSTDHGLKILPAQRDTMFRGPIILTGDER